MIEYHVVMKHFPIRAYYQRARHLGILLAICMIAYLVMRLFFDTSH